MADPTLTDLLDAIAAMHAEIRTSFVADRTDREKLGADIRDAIARVQPNIIGMLPALSRSRTMNNDVTPFEFEGQMVRVIDRDGGPWWVLSEVGKVLEIANARQDASRLDDDEKGVTTLDTPGGPQKVAIVSESGLNKLIMTGRTSPAKRFTSSIWTGARYEAPNSAAPCGAFPNGDAPHGGDRRPGG